MPTRKIMNPERDFYQRRDEAAGGPPRLFSRASDSEPPVLGVEVLASAEGRRLSGVEPDPSLRQRGVRLCHSLDAETRAGFESFTPSENNRLFLKRAENAIVTGSPRFFFPERSAPVRKPLRQLDNKGAPVHCVAVQAAEGLGRGPSKEGLHENRSIMRGRQASEPVPRPPNERKPNRAPAAAVAPGSGCLQ